MRCLICNYEMKEFHAFERKAVFNKPMIIKGSGQLVQMKLGYCKKCRHISSNVSENENWKLAEEKIYKDLYANFTPGDMSQTQRKYTNFLFNWLIQKVGQKGSLLEIGCHDGYFLNMFQKHGWFCRGVEPSPAAKTAWDKYGIETINDFFKKGQFNEAEFDFVVAKHVIEHVSEPLRFIQEMADIIKPGGYLYIEVPNSYQSLQETYFPEFHIDHISYFTLPSLVNLISLIGSFEIVHLESTYAHMKFPFIHLLARKAGINKKQSTWFSDFSIEFAIDRFKVNYPIFIDNLKDLKNYKIGLWGAGSCGTQFAIDGEWKEENVIVVDPAKVNQGKYLTVTGHQVNDPTVLKDANIEFVVIASGWENDALIQCKEILGDSVTTLLFADLLRKQGF